MLFYTGLIFLVFAVSLDGFGVGITYGLRKIHVPFVALLIIMSCSGIVVLLSMTIGNILSKFISPDLAKIFGGSILIFLGLFSLYNIWKSKRVNDENEKLENSTEEKNFFKTVFTSPDQADLDGSGSISINEAILLGMALALDAFGAGIGASIIGYSPILTTILISCMSGLFVFGGIKVGLLLTKSKLMQKMSFIPPLLLITLGIFNMF